MSPYKSLEFTAELPSSTNRSTVTRKPYGFYRPELDVLRFLAFLLIYVCHIFGRIPNVPSYIVGRMGSVGMPLFFVLSSYLITSLLLKEREATQHVSIRLFFLRRIFRIWPLYFATLAFAYLEANVVPLFSFSKHHIAAFLLFFGNWYSIWKGPVHSPWAPLWSINIEEQFYLIWPFLVQGGRHVLVIVSSSCIVVGFIMLFVLGSKGYRADDLPVWYNSFVQFIFFGLGSWLALHPSFEHLSSSVPRRFMLVAALVSTFLYSWVGIIPPQSAFLVCFCYLFAAIASTCLLLAMHDLPAKFRSPFLLRLGKISFGLYVLHGPILAYLFSHLSEPLSYLRSYVVYLLVSVLGLVATVCCAEVSYRLLETPFLRLKQRFEVVHSRPL